MSKKIKNKNKHIFILGSYHGNNFGDMEILDTLISRFYRDFNLSVLTRNSFKLKSKLISQYFEDGNIDFVNPINIIKVLTTIIRSDVVLVGGGGLFFSYGVWDTLRIVGKSQLLYWLKITIISRILGKKVYWFGVGIGPLDKFGKFLVNICSKFVNKIYVRDALSFKYLHKFTKKEKLVLMSDVVFTKLDSRKVKKNLEKKEVETKQILLVIFEKGNSQKLEDLIRLLKVQNYRITITSTNPDKDSKFNQQLASKANVNYIDLTNFSLIQFRNMFNKFDLVISMRMHALLMAYQQGIMGIGISDEITKVKEIQNQLYAQQNNHQLYSASYKLIEPLRILTKHQYNLKNQSLKNYENNYKLADLAFKDLLIEFSS